MQIDNSHKRLHQSQRLYQLPLQQYRKFPYCSIGVMTAQNRGYFSSASAFLISPNLVLTAAHNLCNRTAFQSKDRFRLSPRVSMDQIGGIQCEEYRCSSKFEAKHMKKQKDLDNDYGLVKLATRHSLQTNASLYFQPLARACPICLTSDQQNRNLKIYGYPVSQEHQNYRPLNIKGTKYSMHQYGSRENRIMHIQQGNKIYYKMARYRGMGGSPLNFQQKIIGIHLGPASKKGKGYNVGRLFTTQMLDNLLVWAKELGGDPFKVENKECLIHSQKEEHTLKLSNQLRIKGRVSHQYSRFDISKLNTEEWISKIQSKIQQLLKTSIIKMTLKSSKQLYIRQSSQDIVSKPNYFNLRKRIALINKISTKEGINKKYLIFLSQIFSIIQNSLIQSLTQTNFWKKQIQENRDNILVVCPSKQTLPRKQQYILKFSSFSFLQDICSFDNAEFTNFILSMNPRIVDRILNEIIIMLTLFLIILIWWLQVITISVISSSNNMFRQLIAEVTIKLYKFIK